MTYKKPVQCYFSDRIYVIEPPDIIRRLIEKRLKTFNPERIKQKTLGNYYYHIPKELPLYEVSEHSFIIPRGMVLDIQQIFRDTDIEYEWIDKSTDGLSHVYSFAKDVDIRDYQDSIIHSIQNNHCGIIVAPAGGGKTMVGLKIIETVGTYALWITHTKDLLGQSAQACEKLLGITPSLIGGGRTIPKVFAPVTIAMVQTLVRQPNLLKKLSNMVGTVIVDECHHVPSTTFSSVLSHLSAKRMYGLTATPERRDQKDYLLASYLGRVIAEVERKKLYEDSFLVIPTAKIYYTEETSTLLTSDSNQFSDFGGDDTNYQGMVSILLKDEKRKQLILQTLNSQDKKRFGLVISDRIEYLNELYEGVNTRKKALIIGALSKEKRQSILTAAKKSEYTLLFATSQLVREGLDLPNLTDLYLTTPMNGDTTAQRRDGSAVEQAVGRIMRPDPSNPLKTSVVHDFVDYHNSIFKKQYYNRRRVYKRLGMDLPKKKKTSMKDDFSDLFGDDFDYFK